RLDGGCVGSRSNRKTHGRNIIEAGQGIAVLQCVPWGAAVTALEPTGICLYPGLSRDKSRIGSSPLRSSSSAEPDYGFDNGHELSSVEDPHRFYRELY